MNGRNIALNRIYAQLRDFNKMASQKKACPADVSIETKALQKIIIYIFNERTVVTIEIIISFTQ